MVHTRRVPRGYEVTLDSKGQPKLVKAKRKEPVAKTISFRVPVSDYVTLIPFVDSFEEREWGVALRWLLTQDEVRAVIQAQVRSATRRRP